MKKLFTCSLPLMLISLFLPATANSTGLSKPVLIGPKAMGMGGAFVAIADDPSAIYHNPAGITQLEGHHFEAGMDALITDLDYTPAPGAGESVKREFLPVPQFFYATDHFELVSLGLGVYFPHGNGGKFSAASLSPANPMEGRIYSMEIAPAIAWQIIPELSIGATLRVVRISSTLKGQAVAAGALTDILEDLSLSGWGIGASAGVLYKPVDWLSVGINYRSTIKKDVAGTAQFTTLGAQPAAVNQVLPTLVTMGVSLVPMENLTIGLSYDYERNSEVDELTLTLSALPAAITLPQNWSDSHTIHLGGEYLVLPELAARVGYAKDLNRSIPDAAMNRIIGDIAAHEVSTGLAYTWERYQFAVTWNARFGHRTIANNGTNLSPGDYDAFVQSISLGVGIEI